MAFRFPLAAVLLVRQNAEEREERALKKLQLEMAHALRQVEELDGVIARANHAREQAMQQPIVALQLHGYLWESHQAAEKRQALLHRIAVLRLEIARQMKAYQAAHRDREALSDMQEKQQAAYALKQSREQQKQLDDIFMARRQRG